MLLIECTLPSGLKRVSSKQLALENPWDGLVCGMGQLQLATKTLHGGYVAPVYGNISFYPSLFADDWYPPKSFAIAIYYTATTEAAKELFFSGTAHREAVGSKKVRYGLYAPDEYDTEVAAGTSQATFGTDLNALFTWACDATRLNLSLNATMARSPSPAIVHTTASDRLLIDLLNGVSGYHTHLFRIIGSTLYLVDMFADNGTETVDEFKVLSGDHRDQAPYSEVTDGDEAAFSDYPYGKEFRADAYETNASDIQAAFGKIEEILARPQISLRLPISGGFPSFGKKYSYTAISGLYKPTDINVWARNITLDPFDNKMIVVGDATAVAA